MRHHVHLKMPVSPPRVDARAHLHSAAQASVLGYWGNTMRDAVRNAERWKRRGTPTRDPSTNNRPRQAHLRSAASRGMTLTPCPVVWWTTSRPPAPRAGCDSACASGAGGTESIRVQHAHMRILFWIRGSAAATQRAMTHGLAQCRDNAHVHGGAQLRARAADVVGHPLQPWRTTPV